MVDGTVSRKKYAVIVTTYGEVEDVTIRNLWPSSRKILKAVTRQIVHIPAALIYFIADYRSTKHYIKWKINHYQSSLLAVNRAQTERLSEALAASRSPFLSTIEVDVTDAYYFVLPSLEEKLQQLRSYYDGVVVVPMIPVESAFSCGVACQMVVDSYGESSFSQVRVLSKLWNDERLHNIYANYLFGQIAAPLQRKKKKRRQNRTGARYTWHAGERSCRQSTTPLHRPCRDHSIFYRNETDHHGSPREHLYTGTTRVHQPLKGRGVDIRDY